jgi:hypothetical protein
MDNADVVVFLCSNMIDQEVIGFSGEKFDYREYLTRFFFSLNDDELTVSLECSLRI